MGFAKVPELMLLVFNEYPLNYVISLYICADEMNSFDSKLILLASML